MSASKNNTANSPSWGISRPFNAVLLSKMMLALSVLEGVYCLIQQNKQADLSLVRSGFDVGLLLLVAVAPSLLLAGFNSLEFGQNRMKTPSCGSV